MTKQDFTNAVTEEDFAGFTNASGELLTTGVLAQAPSVFTQTHRDYSAALLEGEVAVGMESCELVDSANDCEIEVGIADYVSDHVTNFAQRASIAHSSKTRTCSALMISSLALLRALSRHLHTQREQDNVVLVGSSE